jgi:transcription antitermination protein NusB
MTDELHAMPPSGDEDGQDEAPPPDSRRGARQAAVQALYWEISTSDDPHLAVRQLGERFGHSAPVKAFSETLIETVKQHQTELDEHIATSGSRWKPERMARLDLIILRLALAEILHMPDVPMPVSIHEAVDLAKLYSTGKSYAFVNGVLDAIVQKQGLQH